MTQGQFRHQTPTEECINCLSHGAGVIGVLWMMPHLVTAAERYGDSISVIGARVYCITLILLYASSTIYHGVPRHRKRTKKLFNILDHVSVYLLIAGTYTPFMLDAIRGPLGWTLLGLIWSLAIIGSILKFKGQLWRQPYSVAYYLIMGWLVLIAAGPLTDRLTLQVALSLLAGGMLYSIGVYFYLSHHQRYAHFVWHLFVLGGSAAHISAVLGVYGG